MTLDELWRMDLAPSSALSDVIDAPGEFWLFTNSTSSEPEFDFLDENGDSQFAEWLEESLSRLKAGQDRP